MSTRRALHHDMKTPFTALLVAHGAFHLLGFAKAFGLADISLLRGPMSASLGSLWLVAALALFASAALFAKSSRDWSILAPAALGLSQILIVTCWSDVKVMTLANVIILGPLVLSFVRDPGVARGTSPKRKFRVTAQSLRETA